MRESHFSTGCSKAMPGKDSEIKNEFNEIGEMIPDTGMHQAWREPAWVPGGLQPHITGNNQTS